MSKKVSPAGSQKVNMPPQPPKTGITKPAPNDWLRYAPYLLLIAVVAVYANTLSFEFTELDDSIFIREFTAYNEDLANLLTSFTRGVFNATTDPYYRPLFLDSIILNYQMYNTDIAGYHAFNLIFHAIAVVLLHKLLLKMKVIPLHSFWLALLFAIHPVLCQAVAWIPGRNDTMLAIFTFAYIINAINYANEEAKVPLLALGLALLFLLLAFFTKETAVFAPPVAFVLILMGLGQSWNSNRMYALYGSAVVAFTIWYIARHNATIAVTPIKPMEMLTSFVGRLGLIIQYLGKIVCPANLSVFPIQQDTTYFIGIPAIALLIALAYMNKDRQWKQILTASAVFFLFLLPALLVPNTLNEQAFEHRLYLPMLGVLLFLPQTVVFQKLSSVELSRYFGIYCLALIVVNFVHQRNFRNPPVFWNQAVATSPHSAYANMMLGARIENLEGNTGTKEEKLQQSYKLFRTAYALNPKEKYLGYYYGRMLQLQDSTLESEKHLLAEKKLSGYYECDFYLARVAVMKHDTAGAIKYIENFLKTDTASQPGNQNLLLMYMQTGRRTEAESLAVKMQRMHIPLPGAK